MKLRIGRQVAEQSSESSTKDFKFDAVVTDMDKLRIIRQWYRTELRLKVSLATLVRLAISEFIEVKLAEIEKAKAGRLHAKLRPQGQN